MTESKVHSVKKPGKSSRLQRAHQDIQSLPRMRSGVLPTPPSTLNKRFADSSQRLPKLRPPTRGVPLAKGRPFRSGVHGGSVVPLQPGRLPSRVSLPGSKTVPKRPAAEAEGRPPIQVTFLFSLNNVH